MASSLNSDNFLKLNLMKKELELYSNLLSEIKNSIKQGQLRANLSVISPTQLAKLDEPSILQPSVAKSGNNSITPTPLAKLKNPITKLPVSHIAYKEI